MSPVLAQDQPHSPRYHHRVSPLGCLHRDPARVLFPALNRAAAKARRTNLQSCQVRASSLQFRQVLCHPACRATSHPRIHLVHQVTCRPAVQVISHQIHPQMHQASDPQVIPAACRPARLRCLHLHLSHRISRRASRVDHISRATILPMHPPRYHRAVRRLYQHWCHRQVHQVLPSRNRQREYHQHFFSPTKLLRSQLLHHHKILVQHLHHPPLWLPIDHISAAPNPLLRLR